VRRGDRAIGIALGLALGIVIVVVFVFVFSGETIDEPSLSGEGQQMGREAEGTATGANPPGGRESGNSAP
jgi:hypothetical protein